MNGLICFPGEKVETLRSKIMAFTVQTPDLINAMAKGLSEEELHRRPRSDQWCIVELVCHLTDIDVLALQGRVQALVEKDRAAITPVNPDELAEQNNYIQRSYEAALSAFRSARQESITTLQHLSAEHWNRVGIHPRYGEVSLGSWIVAWFFHDCSHLRQVLNRRMHLFNQWVGGYGAGYADDLRL